MKNEYNVKIMKSWGNLPEDQIYNWRIMECDHVIASMRPVSECLPLNEITADKPEEQNPNLSDQLPIISILAASTTRNISKPYNKTLPLYKYILPSLLRTLDCGFRYDFVLGYDKGDSYYDSESGLKELKAWFNKSIESTMLKNGIIVNLRTVRVNNVLRKPGPVFNEVARVAYNNGASYFFRINDDTELIFNWPKLFAHTIGLY
jgi:hypothetical protein